MAGAPAIIIVVLSTVGMWLVPSVAGSSSERDQVNAHPDTRLFTGSAAETGRLLRRADADVGHAVATMP